MAAEALIANLKTRPRIPHALTVPLTHLNRHSRILEEEVGVPARRDVRVEQAVFPPVNEAANFPPLGVEQRKAIGAAADLFRIAFASHVAAGYAVGGGTLIIEYLVAAEAFLPELNAGIIVAAHFTQVLTLVLCHYSIEFCRGSVGKSPGKHVVGITAASPRHIQPSVVNGRFQIPDVDSGYATAGLASVTRAWDVALGLGGRADWGRVKAVVTPALYASLHACQVVARSCAHLRALVVCEAGWVIVETLRQNARTGAALELPDKAAQTIPPHGHGTGESCGGGDD